MKMPNAENAVYLMRNRRIEVLDIVPLTEDPPERSLVRGQVGTIVELLVPDVLPEATR